MAKETLLVVEDAPDIQVLLKIYFSSQGYNVQVAGRGREALEQARSLIPDLILLDVNLPDMLGYDVGRTLRADARTRHIPIIFGTARGERSDKLIGLGDVEAEGYVVKPFDMELLLAEVRNVIKRSKQKNQTHPVTNLPTAELLNEQLRTLLTTADWALATVRIENFDTFTETYGSASGEEVLRFTALALNDLLTKQGQPNDFLGQTVTGPEFTLIAQADRIRSVCEQCVIRFDNEIGLHYNYRDRKQGTMRVTNPDGSERDVPLMAVAIGILDSTKGPFYDLRELMETAEAARQQARAKVAETGKSSLHAA